MQAIVKNGEEILAIFPLADKISIKGAVGYYAQGKIPVNGALYQTAVSLWKTGSKDEPEAKERATKEAKRREELVKARAKKVTKK